MSQFREFEKKAIRLLATAALGSEAVEAVLNEATLVSYEYSGVGYFVTVRHPILPAERVVLGEPLVIGRAGEIEGGFLVFVEDGEFMLECYTAGRIEIPSDFRECEVSVGAT